MRASISEQVDVVPGNPVDANDPLRTDNPLGKMPCLVLATGEALFDSSVIVHFLDRNYDLGLYGVGARGVALSERNMALADGMTDAAVLISSERMFHDEAQVSARWIEHQLGKVRRALQWFERNALPLNRLTIEAIALACGLGYLDWRLPLDWRAEFPALDAWLDEFRAICPEFDLTGA